jgi:hypothetical protein
MRSPSRKIPHLLLRPSIARRALGLAWSIVLSMALNAQDARRVASASVRSRATFTFASMLRELPGGDVLVSDPRENRLRWLDSQFLKDQDVVRAGRGPQEMLSVGGVWRVTHRESLARDFLMNRFVWLVDHRPVRTVTPPQNWRIATDGQLLGVDSLSRLYARVSPSRVVGRQIVNSSDSVQVNRVDLSSGRVEAVATLRRADEIIALRLNARDSIASLRVVRQPFATGDQFVVWPNASYAVVRADPFAIQFCRSDRKCAKPLSPGIPMPRVDDVERRFFLKRTAWSSTVQKWPSHLPVFEDIGLLTVVPDELGCTAVRLTPSARDRGQRYLWLSPSGEWRLLEFPIGTRLLAVTKRGIYAVQRDEDDLERIVRYDRRAVLGFERKATCGST